MSCGDPVGFKPLPTNKLGNGEYDVVIFGLGMRECLLALLLLKTNKRVLILSRKTSFFWDNTNFDLLKLFGRFRNEEPTDEDYEALGSPKAYHIDLIPKVIVTYGTMASLLKEVDVFNKINFKYVDLHVAFNGRTKRVGKLPFSIEDATRASLLSMMQRLRWKSLLQSVKDYRDHPSKGSIQGLLMEDVYAKYGLSVGSQGYIGHGIALYENDEYLEEEYQQTYDRIISYIETVKQDKPTPFLYPVGGKQSVCDIMKEMLLNQENCDVLLQQASKQLLFEDGNVSGVVVGDSYTKTSVVVGDSSWFRDDRQKRTGKVIRSICLLNHPISDCEKGKSVLIGLFKKQLIKAGYKPRDSDISVLCLSWKMGVCPKGIYVVVLSTEMETQKADKEIKPATELLGDVLERFDSVTTMFRPRKASKQQGIYIFKSIDASISLDSMADDVREVYSEIMSRI